MEHQLPRSRINDVLRMVEDGDSASSLPYAPLRRSNRGPAPATRFLRGPSATALAILSATYLSNWLCVMVNVFSLARRPRWAKTKWAIQPLPANTMQEIRHKVSRFMVKNSSGVEMRQRRLPTT